MVNLGHGEAAVFWVPEWITAEGNGLTIDDGCFVFLVQTEDGYWAIAAGWIPQSAARKMAELLNDPEVQERMKP